MSMRHDVRPPSNWPPVSAQNALTNLTTVAQNLQLAGVQSFLRLPLQIPNIPPPSHPTFTGEYLVNLYRIATST